MEETTVKRATEPFFTTKGPGRGPAWASPWSMASSRNRAGQCGSRARSAQAPRSNCGCRSRSSKGWRRTDPQAPARIDGLRACRVLVVDDDPIVAAGTAAMLEDLGHRAIEAGSGEIALQVLNSQSGIDFVINRSRDAGNDRHGAGGADPLLLAGHAGGAGERIPRDPQRRIGPAAACRSPIARRNSPGCWPAWSTPSRPPPRPALWRSHRRRRDPPQGSAGIDHSRRCQGSHACGLEHSFDGLQ